MAVLKDFSAFADFVHPLPLEQLGRILSNSLFAGVPFVGLGEGLWDEVPAIRLERDFMGMRIELGGEPGENGGFTLQVEPFDIPEEHVQEGYKADQVGDLSWYLRFLLEKIEGVELQPPRF